MKNEELSKPPFQASASCPVTEVASGVPCRPRGDGQNQSRHVPLASQFSLHTEIKIKDFYQKVKCPGHGKTVQFLITNSPPILERISTLFKVINFNHSRSKPIDEFCRRY
ncbi:unnamed protein product [Nesidiocoris tenuis]|uniref:Uncharacterized protein n=1 Tax=Nesidiocoris tenuis TaxID=355587 RepID=A0A6H5GYY7_9HEMI|nr:unnamed protein product [Nesidiocoris tenuis]